MRHSLSECSFCAVGQDRAGTKMRWLSVWGDEAQMQCFLRCQSNFLRARVTDLQEGVQLLGVFAPLAVDAR